MNRTLNLLLLLAAVALLGPGCATKPVDNYYTLDYPPPGVSAPSPIPLTLKVRTFRTGEVYRQERIVRRFEENRVTYYDTHRWAAPLERMVAERAMEVLRAAGTFEQVLPYSSPIPADAVLEGEIEAMEERMEGAARTAVVRLRWRITDRATSELAQDGEASCEKPIEGRGAADTAGALSACLAEALDGMAGEIAEGFPRDLRN